MIHLLVRPVLLVVVAAQLSGTTPLRECCRCTGLEKLALSLVSEWKNATTIMVNNHTLRPVRTTLTLIVADCCSFIMSGLSISPMFLPVGYRSRDFVRRMVT